MQVRIDIDKTGEIQDVSQKVDKALTLLRDEFIEDENMHVPVSGGASRNGGGGSLQDSARLHSDQQARDGQMTLRWSTPYAHYQHEGLVMHGPVGDRTYGPDKLNYTSATAQAEWTKHAQKVYGDNWAKAIGKLSKKV